MILKEIIKKEGIETLQTKLQELVSKKVDNDKVVFMLEDRDDEVSFVSLFPEDEDRYITTQMYYDEELDDDNYVEAILTYVADCYWEDFCDLGDEYDEHQSNCVKKLNKTTNY